MTSVSVDTTDCKMPPTARSVGMEDAFRLFSIVKARFGAEPYIYRYFVAIINEYKHGRVGIGGLVERIAVIFEDHPDLIEDFNRFLPEGHKILLMPKPEPDSDDSGVQEH